MQLTAIPAPTKRLLLFFVIVLSCLLLKGQETTSPKYYCGNQFEPVPACPQDDALYRYVMAP
jgi:hypothetical protein